MSKDETRLSWVISEFQYAHKFDTSDDWANLRHMVYAASQALLWHDDSHEAKVDRDAYKFLGGICHANEIACIDAKYQEAA